MSEAFRARYTVRIGDGMSAADGYTTLAAFDYTRRRVTRLPAAFQAALQALARG